MDLSPIRKNSNEVSPFRKLKKETDKDFFEKFSKVLSPNGEVFNSDQTFHNSTSFSNLEIISPESTRGVSAMFTNDGRESTFSRFSDMDPAALSEMEIQSLIESKMRKMEMFNSRVASKEQIVIKKKYKLTEKHIPIITKLQKNIRPKIMKINFFKA